MSERDTVRSALIDAIGWQDGLADAYGHIPGSPERKEAIAQGKLYRALLKKRYGTAQTPSEKALDGAPLVSIDELRRRSNV